ncbi:MAG: hypothetical protein M3203_11330, partial [Actinomycetota bacterium]|nr:hypothetical protein [Actinomycetota bacterium]
MTHRTPRFLVALAMAVALVFLAGAVAGADTPPLPPGVTLPPRQSDTTTSTATSTTAPPSTTSTTA